jgi:N-acetylglucosaminyldiphosphoundecaprenol N-acetyl-beta-D-mannosaminyltransferase
VVIDSAFAAPARVRLLGEAMDLVTPTEVMDFVDRRAARGAKAVIANHNLHSLALLKRRPAMRAFFDMADLVEIDSVPLVLWGKLKGEAVSRAHRCTYLDWRDDFWERADRLGWRVFYLGGAPGVAEEAAEKVRASRPGAVIATRHGYFDRAPGSAENAAVVAEINAFKPDVIFVGMGMPIQEDWIVQNYASLERGVVLSVGAAFDYEAGVQTPAPRWIGRIGLEWLFRFADQPRRLFGRYFVEPWTLAGAAMDDLREVFDRPTLAS